MKKIIEYFSDKSMLVNMITIFVIVLGYLTIRSINKESYPQVDRKMLNISTIYPGASPEEVEINVTIPLEDSINAIDGIEEYSSVSSENYSSIKIVIDRAFGDSEKVTADVRRAIDNVDLPDEILNNPSIYEFKSSNWPIMQIGLISETLTYADLRVRAIDLSKEIKNISDISKVNKEGVLEREVQIKLDLDKLNRNYISIAEVISAIQVNNFEMTGGVYLDDNVDRIITVSSKIQSVEDVGNIILRSTFEGYKIYLRDIAEIVDGFKDEETIFRINGQYGVALTIFKKDTSDIIKTVDKVKETVDIYKNILSETDIDIEYLWDLSKSTRIRIDIVTKNAIIGLLLVIIILFIFMNIKNAFWTAMGIPFSVAFAVLFFKYFNVTINSVSLLGIIVVMGMVVDDAIVISENIFRHKLLGKTWRQAAVVGTMEVAYPVTASILTTVVAFLTLYNLGGIMGDFVIEIPIVVIAILAGSLIEALIILPNHISHRYFKNTKELKIKERKFIIAMRSGYKKALTVVLKLRYLVILFFIGLFALSWYVLFSGNVLKFIAFPNEEVDNFYVSGDVRGGQTLDFSSEKLKIIEKILNEYPTNVFETFSLTIGEIGYPEKFGLEARLKPALQRDISAEDIVTNLRTAFSESGYFTNVVYELETGGPPEGRDVRIEIVGNDNDKRRELSDTLVDYINSIEGSMDIVRSDENNKQELRIFVDYEKLAKVGVSPLTVGQTIRTAFNGVIATTIQTPEELLEYRVVLEDKYKEDFDTLYDLYVLNNQNRLIGLSKLITMEKQAMVSKIDHYNGDRNTIIEADLNQEIITPKEVFDMINKDFKNFEEENPGYKLIIGGGAKSSQETVDSMIKAAIIAIIGIFFILILQFRSFTQSFIVLLAVPFSFIGVAIALLMHNMPLSSMALFGGVGLIGVVVNDSIVMVDHINSLRSKFTKESRLQKIVEGSMTRMRPVILTTLTTVAGLLPTAYGFGGTDMMIMPTTLTMSWGLVFATFLTLFLIPSLYMVEYDITNGIKKLFNRNAATKSSNAMIDNDGGHEEFPKNSINNLGALENKKNNLKLINKLLGQDKKNKND